MASTTSNSAVARTVLLCLVVITMTYLWHSFEFWHYINDDAFITFRYSRFLALGRGPYFNVGEHVEGYTNVLAMLITAGFIGTLGPELAPAATKMIGVLSGAGCVVLAHAMTAYLLAATRCNVRRAPLWGIVAAAIVAVSPAFVVNTTSGLETALFSALVTTGAFLGTRESVRGQWYGSGIAFGAAAWTRPEGIVLFTAFWCGQAAVRMIEHCFCAEQSDDRSVGALLRHRGTRALIANGAIVTGLFAALFGLRHLLYDGEWLPNTYYAKERSVTFWQARKYVERGMLPAVLGIGGVLVGCAGYLSRFTRILPWIPIAALTAMGCVMPFLSGTDWMLGARLVIPYLPVLAICVVGGWALLSEFVLRRYARIGLLVAIGVLPVLWQRQAGERKVFHDHTTLRARGYTTGHIALAEWLRDEAAHEGDTIALMDIGLVGYKCFDQSILDLTGLTDRFIARSAGGFLDKQYDPEYVLDQAPRFIVLILSARGTSYSPPPAGTEFAFWTEIEKRIYDHPDFQEHYLSPQPAVESAVASAASQFGATRIFEHGHPGLYYLLAVFERQDAL